ncbi:MAG TPA: precorrin-6A reductase [Fibrobacteria bacterium]|nr:precorrin-6A reductase [Fibrobacteria bacterium]
MILLAGGTTESVHIARWLTNAGHHVLVTQATEIQLDLPDSPLLRLRRGRLDAQGFQELLGRERIRAVVDASHPFAGRLRSELEAACRSRGISRIRFERSAPPLPSGAVLAQDHADAAHRAFALGRTVLLTTGSRTLGVYAGIARCHGAVLWARIAPSEESDAAVLESGLDQRRIVRAKGPFSVEDTMALLERSGADVLVAKDSGDAGGILRRIDAAWRCGAHAVVVRRPDPERGAVTCPRELLSRLWASE